MKSRPEYERELTDPRIIVGIIKDYIKNNFNPPFSAIFAGIAKKYIKGNKCEIVSTNEREELQNLSSLASAEVATKITDLVEKNYRKTKRKGTSDEEVRKFISSLLSETLIWKLLAERLYVETRLGRDKIVQMEQRIKTLEKTQSKR